MTTMFKINHIVAQCRNMVRMSRDKKIYPTSNDRLIGIVYDGDGRYQKYYISAEPNNVAKFIYSSENEKMITTINDWAIMNTICGTFLDLSCAHQDYTDKVLKYLMQYQEKEEYQKFDMV